MAYKTLIFGTDDLYPKLKPFYAKAVKKGILEIVACAVLEDGGIRRVAPDNAVGGGDDFSEFDLAIISSNNDFYHRMKLLEANGIPRNRIIDGRVFQVPGLNFPQLLKEGVAYGVIEKTAFLADAHVIYPQAYKLQTKNISVFLDKKSFIVGCRVEGVGALNIGKYSSIAIGATFELGRNHTHNYRNVGSYSFSRLDWKAPKEFLPPQGTCKIEIGNDVWIGRGNFFKCTNPNKPLVIGDGAVIASDSVVVKNVPPYAIVGGNPAKIIKFRFSEDVIESLLRIKWWDWDIDKIYDNFKYFNDIEKFIAMHDKG